MDQREAEDRDDITDDCDDNAANGDGHGISGHGREDLADDDNVYYGESTSDDHIENRAELCTPETERVTRCYDCTHTELGFVSLFDRQNKYLGALTLGPRVPVDPVQREPRMVPATMAATDWLRESPKTSGPRIPIGSVPT